MMKVSAFELEIADKIFRSGSQQVSDKYSFFTFFM